MNNHICQLSISAPQSALDEIEKHLSVYKNRANTSDASMVSVRLEEAPETQQPVVHIRVSGAASSAQALTMIRDAL
jgi:hypothetical protein